ncbi:Elongator complex protein 5 [Halteromyces radiatus]|uniref:Elongator complex protein 5 n=1 Tax=Halteromyces radiatus TaxID=101107 RepID=UPI002220A57F|nr:Elongator complex protein 5 [Halteromyces radiatus]KAI8086009.1 Elongator complex protein 5 [Halteromyces radiatus]
MAQLCLDQLLSNRKTSSLILINDSIRFSALPLLYEFSQRALDTDQQIITLLTETSPTAWLQTFNNNKNKIHIIDAFSDPLGWELDSPIIYEKDTQGGGSLVRLTRLPDFERHVLPLLMDWIKKAPATLIMVDSLTPLTRISSHRTYQFVKALESLTTETIRAVVGYHADIRPMIDNKTMIHQLPPLSDSLNRLASVVMTLEQLKAPTAQTETQARLTGFVAQDTFSYLHTTSNQVTRGGVAKIEWRRKSGKVIYETNGFLLDNGRLVVVPASQLGVQEQDENEESDDDEKNNKTDTPDPTANLSFNLSLTDEQRKTKENLVLPYLKAQQVEIDGSTSSSTSSSGGAIYYEPDAADDFDDEDPDDDLDI